MTLKHKQRIFYILILLTAMVIVVILRLAYIQLIMRTSKLPESKYTLQQMSVMQRERGVVLDSGRGRFVDRNGLSLSDEILTAAVLFPVSQKVRNEAGDKLESIADALSTDAAALEKTWSSLSVPMVWTEKNQKEAVPLTKRQAEILMKQHVSGIEVLPYVQRYKSSLSGMQWLGYLTQQPGQYHLSHTGYAFQEGGAGLEKTLEPLLRGIGQTTAYYVVDGANKPIPGTGFRVKGPENPYYPLQFNTTVDKSLQDQIEQLTESFGMKEGAVVVLDADHADVVAMVSRPFYNPLDIYPDQDHWNNRAVQAAVPGSIFKTIVAAAALEAGVSSPEESFYCSGHYGKYGLSCWKEGGHGEITLREAFAKSCNVAFATVAERLSGEQLESAADRLGLGRSIGWQEKNVLGIPLFKPFDHEERGTVFAPTASKEDGGTRVQTGIGQRDVKVTPLQAANLVVTLLHAGEVHAPRILSSITYANGQLMKALPPHLAPSSSGSIEQGTANMLASWMKDVVTDGTGRILKNSNWTLAGKSGTAQVIDKGKARNNQWFIGYGPAEKPKYAVAVLMQNVQPSSSNRATELFGQVMNLLAAHSS